MLHELPPKSSSEEKRKRQSDERQIRLLLAGRQGAQLSCVSTAGIRFVVVFGLWTSEDTPARYDS